jgi:hypothetical protein
MNASYEKARRASAELNFKIVHARNSSTTCGHIEPARLRYFTRRIHALAELLAGASLAERLPIYAAHDPSILTALSGITLPPAAPLIGRAFK